MGGWRHNKGRRNVDNIFLLLMYVLLTCSPAPDLSLAGAKFVEIPCIGRYPCRIINCT